MALKNVRPKQLNTLFYLEFLLAGAWPGPCSEDAGTHCESQSVFNVTIDPAVSSPSFNPRPPTRPDQADNSNDFAALVDSNTNAASDAGTMPSQPYTRSPTSNDDGDSSQNNQNNTSVSSADSQQQATAPQSNPTNQQPQTPTRSSTSSTSRTTAADPRSKPKDKLTKTADKTADTGQKPAAAADVSNPNAAAAAITTVSATAAQDQATAKSDTTSAINATAATATQQSATTVAAADAKAADGTAKPALDPATGLPLSKSSDGTSDGKASTAASDANGQTKLPDGVTLATPVATGLVVPQAAGANAKPGTATPGVQQISQGKGASKASSAKPADADQTAAKKAGAQDKPDGTAATDDGSDTKADAGSVTTDTAQASTPATHDHNTAGTQSPKPDTNFQSVLDLQQQPQQLQTNFTVTAAGPTASAQAASTPVPLNGLAVDIATKAAAGNSSFQIRLDPAELGRIDVRLDVDKHGQVTSHLTVERPATLDMLRNDAPKLQQALEDAGLKTGDSGLQFSLRDQSSQSRNDDGSQSRNSQRVIVSEDVPAATPVTTSYSRARGSSAGVDISI